VEIEVTINEKVNVPIVDFPLRNFDGILGKPRILIIDVGLIRNNPTKIIEVLST